ncbi:MULTISPECIES: alpha/beta hydrolase [unclassified Amycolatopsis]|uniref:alpha/beta hydrolase n=1 Tax=unclassified Amycolatopsis TaxID=2618356 RepID=UPI00106EDC35|nr:MULTISPECIES: alpha/beta hydrolase [unclassified Amycolatopsis]
MVSLADVRAWNPNVLDEVCSAVRAKVQVLVSEGDDYGKLLPVDGWSGPAAEGAAAQHKTHMQGLDTYVAGVAAIGKAVGQAADAILAVQAAIKNADELARKYGFAITADGAIVCVYAGDPPPELHPQDRARAQQQLADDVAQILRTAEDIDSDLAAVLDKAAAGQCGTGNESTVAAAAADGLKDPGLTLPEPPPNATPAQNAAWWATLSPDGRNILIRDRPGMIGAMDGLPTVDRDRANRTVLSRQHADLQRQRDDIQHRLDGMKRSDPQQQKEYYALQAQRETLDQRLAGIHQIEDRLERSLPGQPPAFLLSVNPADSGQAVVAIGDPDHAANVATYVPGTTSGLNDGMHVDIERADAMMAMAGKVGSPSTSVITWAGYDAPQTLADAASTSYADNAEHSLRAFQEGIGAAHQGPVNTTVIGHSYGTTAVGHTARDLGLPADNLVMVASPGVGVDHANQLHLDAVPQDQVGQHIYSTKALTDPVPALTNLHSPQAEPFDPLGPDPATDYFGGQTFESDPGHVAGAHSNYWVDRSPSLRAMGNIIAGNKP